MLFSTRIAAIFFAVALLGWGIIHFIIGDFAAGRAPAWPEGVPGKIAWAYISGITLIVAAVSIFTNQTSLAFAKRYGGQRLAVTCAGVMILLWAGSRNLVIVLSTLDYGGQMTNTGKSLTIGFGALAVVAAFPMAVRLASIFTGLFFIASGIQHFIFIQFVKTLVPSWIPGAEFWSYLAGVALIASGIALITGIQRKLAALLSSWMVFIWFVILHVPRGFGATANTNEWIAIFEALSVSAILAVIYHTSSRSS
ncbi:MAG TPA: DoxX family membrane protein [Cyclobacteriaceae bacterium]|nr:DoxX family membrane protein [Cyclobacteriaceae bacterium]